ncbi:MAG: P-loop NTPase [Candidatus Nezhaarchaeales archaeon]
MKLAVSGKGGCGKSTIVALLSKVFVEMGFKVLVVDADESNVGLLKMLGLENVKSLVEVYGGRIGLKAALDRGLEFLPDVNAITAGEGKLRAVRVGKIERGGEGCACIFGILTKEVLSKLTSSGDEIVLIDMEAGVEHLGRGIDQVVDAILFVVDPTLDSIVLAERANKMAAELGVSKFMVVLNKIDSETAEVVQSRLLGLGVKIIGKIRYDPEVVRSALLGETIRARTAMVDAVNLAKAILEELRYGIS